MAINASKRRGRSRVPRFRWVPWIAGIAAVFGSASCANNAASTGATAAPAPAAPVTAAPVAEAPAKITAPNPASVSQPTLSTADFSKWLMDFRAEAAKKGISTRTLESAFVNVEPLPRVLELDRSQPEFVQTFAGYLRPRVTETRINKGRELLARHSALFKQIEQQYGVQGQYLVAFWGLESDFGAVTGGFSAISALATLAYDPRRSQMYRDELLTALQIIDAGHIKPEAMKSSWAGAMGQCQFMPSTFKRYAVDGDGDGHINIWQSLPDVMHSAANYLSQAGWKGDERWGREVVLPANFDFALSGTTVRKSVSEWNALGVRKADGSPLGNASLQASVVVPAGAKGPAFLTYNNFRTAMVWNRSVNYALSVGLLADRLMGETGLRHAPDANERPMDRAAVEEMQQRLNAAGINVGVPDGVPGSRTRDGVREYQLKYKLVPDGYASYEFLEQLRKATP